MKARVAVCTPCYGNPDASRPSMAYAAVMFVMSQEWDVLCGEQGWDSADIEIEPSPYPEAQEHARNNLARIFLESPRNYTHALLWDADEKGTPRQIWQCLSAMLKADYPIASVSCPEKHYMWEKAAKAVLERFQVGKDGQIHSTTAEELAHIIKGHACRYVPNKASVTLGPLQPDGFAQILKGFTTLGFALVKRSVFEQMIEAYRDSLTYRWTDYNLHSIECVGLFHTTLRDRVFESEDLAFCTRWRAIGGSMYLYLGEGSPLGHIGSTSFSGTREAMLYDWGFSRE